MAVINLEALGDVEIVLVGNAQIGKSTLVNVLLQSNLAVIGNGMAVGETRGFQPYKHPNLPVVLWDGEGIEVQKWEEQFKTVREWFIKREGESDPLKTPFILLCVSEEEPIQDFHKQMFDWFSERVAVIVVLLKAKKERNDAYLRAAKESFPGARICRVNAIESYFDDSDKDAGKYCVRGLAELSDAMIPSVQEGRDIRKNWLKLRSVRTFERMRDNALTEIPSIANKIGLIVGVNPFPCLNDIPAALKRVIEVCGKCFAVELSEKFIDDVKDNESPDKGKRLWRFIPIFYGFSAREFVLAFGKRFVSSLYKTSLAHEFNETKFKTFEQELQEDLRLKE